MTEQIRGQITGQVQVTRDIDAAPEVVWALVSDLTRMGEWSPENEGGIWVGGATGPAPGAKFKGRNTNGGKTWSTEVRVLDADPGTRFSFLVSVGPFKVAEWAYDIKAIETGCRVTETWTDRRGRLITRIGAKVSGVDDRGEFTRDSMEITLDRLAATATTTATTPDP